MVEITMWNTSAMILILQCALLLALLQSKHASAACPLPPVQCDSESCYVSNYLGKWGDQNPCKVAKAFFPRTEAELIQAVAYAVKEGRKIKVVSGGSHSLNRFACPGGDSGVVISTRDYNSRITVDEESMTVTVDAGVGLRKLSDTLAEKGYALTHTTDWDGISMGGVVSMAAHGSGIWGKGSGIHQYVVGMSLVVPATADEGYAKLVYLMEGDKDLKAARVSVGVLGAISQITFAVEEIFKRSATLKLKDDSDLEESLLRFARSHEYGSIRWYPSFRQVTYMVVDKVSVDVAGNGTLSNVHFRPSTVQGVVQRRAAEEENNARENASKLCSLVKRRVEQHVESGGGYLNDGQGFKGYPVVGFTHLMQSSSGCEMGPRNEEHGACAWEEKQLEDEDTICGWDAQVEGDFYFHSEIAIPLSRVAEAIRDIKLLRDLDPSAMCTIDYYIGIHMRYFTKSEDYLALSEDSVTVDFIYMQYREADVPRWNGHVMEEMEQMLLQKYGGVPHWGKNRVFAFEGAATRTVNLGKFLEVKERLDPEGFFSSEWSDGVLGIGKGVEIWRDGCALDGLCVCKEDRHCAPEKGFFCRNGNVWSQARVCRQGEEEDQIISAVTSM